VEHGHVRVYQTVISGNPNWPRQSAAPDSSTMSGNRMRTHGFRIPQASFHGPVYSRTRGWFGADLHLSAGAPRFVRGKGLGSSRLTIRSIQSPILRFHLLAKHNSTARKLSYNTPRTILAPRYRTFLRHPVSQLAQTAARVLHFVPALRVTHGDPAA